MDSDFVLWHRLRPSIKYPLFTVCRCGHAVEASASGGGRIEACQCLVAIGNRQVSLVVTAEVWWATKERLLVLEVHPSHKG